VKGLTPLHYAALAGSSEITDFFLRSRADSNPLSYYGDTSLHLALQARLQGPEYSDAWTKGRWEFMNVDEGSRDKTNAQIAEFRIASGRPP
jgi:hypothetical protein